MTTSACASPNLSPQTDPTLPLPATPGQDTYFLSLSIFRILLASYILADTLFNLLPYATIFFSDSGIYPRAMAISDLRAPDVWSLLFLNGTPWFAHVFLGAYALAAVGLLVGYRTRLMTFLLLIGTISIFWRTNPLTAGYDMLLRLLLLWSLFVPLARYYSLDAARTLAAPNRPYPWLPIAVLKIQVSAMYVFSGIYKLAGPTWLDGTALDRIVSGNVFVGGLLGPEALPALSTLFPFITWGTVLFQLTFPLWLYLPGLKPYTRGPAIALAFLMHLGFLLFLNVGWFPWLCFAYLVILVPDAWWQRLFAARRHAFRHVAIYYQPDCGFCHRVSLLLRNFCLPPTVPVQPASAHPQALQLLQQHNSWVVFNAQGQPLLAGQALAWVWRRGWWSAPLGWLWFLPILRPAYHRAYHWVGHRREAFGTHLATLMPWQPPTSPGRLLVGTSAILCAIMLLHTTLTLPAPAWHIWGLPTPPMPVLAPQHRSVPHRPGQTVSFHHWYHRVAYLTQTQQNWNLFAPNPTTLKLWPTLTAISASGQRYNGQALLPSPAFLPNPHGPGVVFTAHRWLKYFERLGASTPERQNRRNRLFTVWCRQLRTAHPGLNITHLEFSMFTPQRPAQPATQASPPTWRLSFGQVQPCTTPSPAPSQGPQNFFTPPLPPRL